LCLKRCDHFMGQMFALQLHSALRATHRLSLSAAIVFVRMPLCLWDCEARFMMETMICDGIFILRVMEHL
jgi:hypothetical protein